MSETETPSQGGSYLRHPDGRLERVETTTPAEPRAAEPSAPATDPNLPPTEE